MNRRRVECVGGIVLDESARLLLVLRANEPAKGCWSVPGGRKEAGESDAVATAREVHEETGLRVVVGALAGAVQRDGPHGSVYLIRDYHCALAHGVDPTDVRAGDDAADAGWFTPQQVRNLGCSPGLVETLDRWGLLSPPDSVPGSAVRGSVSGSSAG
ncbi:MAG TPA: NUDIX domain-containing protein [Nocardioidaceae bacterium]|nr:NUDIX domain-containing protein [Nocardioidaceae bacterium]